MKALPSVKISLVAIKYFYCSGSREAQRQRVDTVFFEWRRNTNQSNPKAR
jgi:hypothetical protein